MIEVVAAVIKRNGLYLVAQRPVAKGGDWEFPGGKVEPGETLLVALIREIREEMGVEIQPGQVLMSLPKNIHGKMYMIHFIAAELLNEDIQLSEHQSFQWLSLGDIKKLTMSSVDIEFVNKQGSR